MKIQKAQGSQLPSICAMYRRVVQHMQAGGLYQWDEQYPACEHLARDIDNQHLYVVTHDDQLIAAFAINQDYDPEYDDAAWQWPDARFMVLHRLCVEPLHQGHGIGARVLASIEDMLREMGIECVRLDTFSQNHAAMRLYLHNGYLQRGEAHWRLGLFYIFEKQL